MSQNFFISGSDGDAFPFSSRLRYFESHPISDTSFSCEYPLSVLISWSGCRLLKNPTDNQSATVPPPSPCSTLIIERWIWRWNLLEGYVPEMVNYMITFMPYDFDIYNYLRYVFIHYCRYVGCLTEKKFLWQCAELHVRSTMKRISLSDFPWFGLTKR